MAVSKIICPECQTVLKPAKPLPAGKPVKCPECGSRFTAPEEEAPQPPPKNPKNASAGPEAAERGLKPAVGGKKPSPKKPTEKKTLATAKKPEATKSDDEEGGIYGYVKEDESENDKPDVDYAPDMSTKDLRGPAQSALVQPSNALMIVGLAGFFGWLALIVVHLIPIVFPVDSDDGDKTKQPKQVVRLDPALANVAVQMNIGVATAAPAAGAQGIPSEGPPNIKGSYPVLVFMLMQPSGAVRLSLLGKFLIFFIMVLGMVYSGFVTYAAVRIQSLDGYEWGVAGCILAIVPLCTLWGFISCVAQVAHFLLGMMMDDPAGFTRWLASVIGGIIILLLGASTGVGIWVLVLLRSETVLKGYEYKGE